MEVIIFFFLIFFSAFYLYFIFKLQPLTEKKTFTDHLTPNTPEIKSKYVNV